MITVGVQICAKGSNLRARAFRKKEGQHVEIEQVIANAIEEAITERLEVVDEIMTGILEEQSKCE